MKRGRGYSSLLYISFILLVVVVIIYNVFGNSSSKYKSKTELEEKFLIPKGFYYVGGTVESGIVISDNKEDENKGTDYDTAKDLIGNQFVWVPVNNCTVKNASEISTELALDNYPIALKNNGNDDYIGLLYKLAFKDNREPYFKQFKGQSQNDEEQNREPAILTLSKYGDSEDLILNSTKGLYQDSFNKMINSVKKNKGFYVSRYEIGNLHGDKPVSKANQSDISNMCWIDGYKQIKTMYNSKNVSAEMLWGCQYDAIMIWMYNSDDVREKYFVENTDSVCNRSKNIMPTANSESYGQKNIYDLIGNVYEFTQEAAYRSSRICRGGSYDYESTSSANNMLIREQRGITNGYPNVGFRAYLLF